MRILITGAAGMLGQDVVDAVHAAEFEAIALTRPELDITDGDAVERAITDVAPSVVINCAAWTDVDGAEAAPSEAAAVNADGAGNLTRAAAANGAWTIHVSSDYVFDGTKPEPYVESDQTAPRSEYGRSKLAGEQAVAQEAPEWHTIVRSSWLFGAGGHCFPDTILRFAQERDVVRVVDDQVGCPTFTGHLARALVELTFGRPPLGLVHIAGGGSCSWYEFAAEIVRAAGLDAEVRACSTADMPRAAPRPAYSVLRSERGSTIPTLPEWRQGLEEYMAARVAG
jgi:dTDP-4-dehydrorhamnose reductase